MKLNLICAAGLSLLLAGCGGKGGSLNAASGSVTQAQAVSFFTNSTITQALNSLQPSANAGSPVALPSMPFVDDFASCTTKNPTTPEDNDNDEIPASLVVKFDCPNVSANKSTKTRMGTYEVTDFNDEAGQENQGWGGGFRYQYDFNDKLDAPHEMFEDIYNGFFEVKKTATSLSYHSEYTGTVVGVDKQGNTGDWNWKWQSNWKNIYNPENINEPYKKGTAEIGGFVGISGSLGKDKVSGQNLELNVAFKLKSQNLEYDRSCDHFWSNGSLSYTDGSNNEIRYEFECKGIKIFYNGKDVTAEMRDF